MSTYILALAIIVLSAMAIRYDWTGDGACRDRGGIMVYTNRYQRLCIARDVLR